MNIPNNSDLRGRIEQFLAGRHVASRVDVETVEGTVTLRGRVQSFYQKQLCLSCCHRVAGVREIVDRIEVAWPRETGRARSATVAQTS